MSNLNLRPYQSECLQSIIQHQKEGVARQLVSLPTAAGKTVIFSHLIQETNCKTLVLAHTCELLNQARDKIRMVCPGLDVGLVNAFNKEFDRQVVISSIQSARVPYNIEQLQQANFGLVIADECHHFAADSPKMVLAALGFEEKTSHKLLVGFSATAFRADGRGLGEVFDKIVYQKNIKELIDLGYLCRPHGVKVAFDLDLRNVETSNGDFKEASLAKVMDTPELNELVARTYIEQAWGRQTICFGVTIAHATNLAQQFKMLGVNSAVIHGKMSKDEREAILKLFEDREISILCNCQVLTEGFDCPQVDCVIIARPTKSPGLYQQMAGRGLRLYPNKKDCLILDFSDKSHSLCCAAMLLGDTDKEENRHRTNTTMVSLAHHLPPRINHKLRKAILEVDLLGDSFTWQGDGAGGYFLKGVGFKVLRVSKLSDNLYGVEFADGLSRRSLGYGLTFEYAFAAAEDFAKANRSAFVVSDLEASWRHEPITERQKNVFRARGYKAGIDELSRGQASFIIGSGVLNKKAARL